MISIKIFNYFLNSNFNFNKNTISEKFRFINKKSNNSKKECKFYIILSNFKKQNYKKDK